MTKASKVGERLGSKVSIKSLKGHPDGYKWRAYYIEGGKRRQKYFKTKAAGLRWKEEREEEAKEHGTAHHLTSTERAAVIETRKRVIGVEVGLREVIEKGLEYFEAAQKSETVARVVETCIDERNRAGKSPGYLADLTIKLGRFSKAFGDRSVATVTSDEIADWLHGLKLKPTSFNSYRRTVGVAFSDAVKRGLLIENPVMKVMPMKETESRFSALSPEEAAVLIRSASPEILPAIALGLFTGARDSELKQLDWEDIDISGDEENPHGYVRISAAIAKSSRNRLIPIGENLAAILAPHAKLSGKVWPRGGRRLHEAARRAAGFGSPKEVEEARKTGEELKPWPENALRHSYASHHLAHFKNSESLALNMGHTNTQLIFKHYRQLVKPDDAARFWKIGLLTESIDIQGRD